MIHPTETQIQEAVIAQCKLRRDEARFAFHIPNEAKRSKVGHAMQKRAGLRKGAADVFVPAGRGGYLGFFLELKAHGKKPEPDQVQFAEDMLACGYFASWTDQLDVAMILINQYMAGMFTRPDWVHYSHPVKA